MRYLIHACFDPAGPVPLEPEKNCHCQHRISKTEMDARVTSGELIRIDARSCFEKRNVASKSVPQKAHRATTIQNTNIIRAYVDGNRYQQRRIEQFGPNALKII